MREIKFRAKKIDEKDIREFIEWYFSLGLNRNITFQNWMKESWLASRRLLRERELKDE